MKFQARVVCLWGAGTLAIGLGVLTAGNAGRAANRLADAKGDVIKAAEALAGGNAEEAKKLTEGIAKDNELDEVMALLGKRTPTSKKALGVGKQAGAITPDCIELKLQNLSKRVLQASALNKEADALADMSYHLIVIADILAAKPPEKDEGKKTKKSWGGFTEEMRAGAEELAKAAKAKKPAAVKTAASKTNNACLNCHEIFRDS